MPTPLPSLSPLFRHTADWFDHARAALLGAVPCEEGCHRCCIGVFPVTLLDRGAIQAGLTALPDSQRQRITQTAQEQVASLTSAAPRLGDNPWIDEWADNEVDRLVDQFRDLRCPALLDNGRCAIYESRPLVCRSMGIPTDDGQTVQGACDVQCFVPIARLSTSLRQQEDVLASQEAAELAAERRRTGAGGDECLLPFAFVDLDDATGA